jgi:hypothetical protein
MVVGEGRAHRDHKSHLTSFSQNEKLDGAKGPGAMQVMTHECSESKLKAYIYSRITMMSVRMSCVPCEIRRACCLPTLSQPN